jgi:Spy/CpxP family protein refolding chaperone
MSFGLAWIVPQLPGPFAAGARAQQASNVTKAVSIQEFLDLSADQQKNLEELTARLRTKAQQSEQELEAKQKALRLQLASDNADPIAAGKALLELEVAKRRSESTSAELRAEALQILTPQQREKLTVLEQASKLHSLTRQAMGLFLIPPPDAVISGTGPLGMFPARKRMAKPEFPSAT